MTVQTILQTIEIKNIQIVEIETNRIKDHNTTPIKTHIIINIITGPVVFLELETTTIRTY